MEYRPLGNTGLQVSAIGLGCAILHGGNRDYAARVIRRALDLGVTFFDVARAYGDAEIKLGYALAGHRQHVIVSSKTDAKTYDKAWQDIHESLERLQTSYLDNYHLHGLGMGADMEARLAPTGPLQALIEAKAQGLIRHIGCTAHRSDILIEALNRFDFEVILVPMNLVERDPLAELIPLCQKKGIGVTIMKPLATGLLPAPLALKWLLNQPIASCVPGATTIEEVEENSMVGNIGFALSDADRRRADEVKGELEHVRCRICGDCMPCPVGLHLPFLLGSDVMFDHYRTMGHDIFASFAWDRAVLLRSRTDYATKIAKIEACSHCGECDAKCPYGLPVDEMVHNMAPAIRDMMGIYDRLLGS